jgi:sulfane dehydrogenase subunit SoxC
MDSNSKDGPMGSKRTSRRELLTDLAGGVTLGAVAGGALAAKLTSGAVAQGAPQAPVSNPAPAQGHTVVTDSRNGYPMLSPSKELIAYGERSHYVKSVRISHPMGGRPSPDAFGKQFHIASPLQDSVGVITPSSLHYVATTRGGFIPDIDPQAHTLMIHGLVDRPLTLTMDELKRFPSVTRLHFIECAGNRHNGKQRTVQESHGMTSCSEWTGVLLSTLLKECGLKSSATWFVAEGAEEVKGASSMQIAKAMDDCLIAYGQNGEALRPQQGFPVRIIPPGFEGIFHTKYLRRIKVVDRYYMNYSDFGHLDKEAEDAALGMQVGPKSVITHPSGGQQLPGRGFYEIKGLAWSGGGAIRSVEVSVDGGRKWNPAELKTTPQRMAHVRFAYPWTWDGTETEILSRCTDEIGQVQPTREQVAQYFNVPFERNYRVPGLDNSVMPWRIAKDGSVTNGLA